MIPLETHLQIGSLLFEGLDQIDLTAPFEVFSRLPNSTYRIFAKTTEALRDMNGLRLMADATLADAPRLDVLHVPGGPGQESLMEDEQVLGWLREQAARACCVFSVCTGALLCGAAGLLRGRRVTTHWNAFELLPFVTPERGRALTLWIDAATHLPDHAVMELSVGSETIRFADYRVIQGILLPFKVSVEHGDESESGTAMLADYQVSTAPSKHELECPQPSTADTKLPSGVKATSADAFLDEQTGWFIVPAKVNGQGPYPFILDTGGHNILTHEIAYWLIVGAPPGMVSRVTIRTEVCIPSERQRYKRGIRRRFFGRIEMP